MKSSEADHKDLKDDLNMLRMNVGEQLSEEEIREYLDNLKTTYNSKDNNVALDYHIEVTRFDYGVPVWVTIKRGSIHMKKFVFRFRKSTQSTMNVIGGSFNLTETDEARKNRYNRLMGDK